jgi:nuclear pore complex protein Nup107
MLDLLPAELASIRNPEELSVEFMQYRRFFMVWETLKRVVETQALEVPQMAKDTRAAWLSDYKVR